MDPHKAGLLPLSVATAALPAVPDPAPGEQLAAFASVLFWVSLAAFRQEFICLSVLA